MTLYENVSLKNLNSFGIEANARYFSEITEIDDLGPGFYRELKRMGSFLFLGGGSNILFQKDFDGWVIALRTKGITEELSKDGHILVTAAAGEKWDDLVLYCVDRGYAGIENLSMIPGNAGSAPIQNIGAYGVELKDVFHHLHGISPGEGRLVRMNAGSCQFGYRDSIFKRSLKSRFLITSITLQLCPETKPNLTYAALRDEFRKSGIHKPGLRQVREMVMKIRAEKLPDPAILGNAGSFFKNPSVSEEEHIKLKRSYPDLVSFAQERGNWKLAAGWLIEQCGWKGKRMGGAGVHDKQALVLVNLGNATGREIVELAVKIEESVYERFGVRLEREVNIV